LRPGRALHPIVRTPLALRNTGAEFDIWSGQSDEVKDKTAWLADYGLGHISIRMRPHGRPLALVFEDRASMVDRSTSESNGNAVAEHDLSHEPEWLTEMPPPSAGPWSSTKAPASRGGARTSAARSANSRVPPAARTASGTWTAGQGW